MQANVFQPEALGSQIVGSMLERFLERCPAAAELRDELLTRAGVRLADAIDVLGVPADPELRLRLVEAGFRALPLERQPPGRELWEHPRALFPLLDLDADARLRAFVRVESVVDFLESYDHGAPLALEGDSGTFVRRALVVDHGDAELWVSERCAERRLVTSSMGVNHGPGAAAKAKHLDAFRLRPRPLDEPEAGFAAARRLIDAAREELGDAVACELFFEAERRHYCRKNYAARVVKAQQDALGFGFHNRDHHTYRSSRMSFRWLVETLEALGMVCRERFYAGQDAGWGAQVMEHEETGICVFADVDLSPEEVTGDFAHEGLEPRGEVGTVGLWCELHGEAFLSAGMHHLECQFDAQAITDKLAAHGVSVMPRFTDYPHLKQAFTQGEIWHVAPERIEHAKQAGLLAPEQAERIAREGALGSHFEVLERNLGYKGFNQDGINRIIRATDPRHAEASLVAE